MDIVPVPGFSDFDPTANQVASEIHNNQDWTVLHGAVGEDISPLQVALDERAADMDRIADENRMLLSNYELSGTGEGVEGAAPRQTDTTPDGREVVIYGSPGDYADFCHEQGNNDLGFTGDCGLCSSQDVLNQFGVDVTENDVVHHAVENNLCDVDPAHPDNCGGTTTDWQCQVLNDYGVPAHVENNGTLEDLAQNLENGSGVIAEVNAGVLWNDANSYDDGGSNHAITVTGVERDAETGQITGFYVNDSGDGHAAKFVDAATMQTAWADTGGQSVVTDVTH